MRVIGADIFRHDQIVGGVLAISVMYF